MDNKVVPFPAKSLLMLSIRTVNEPLAARILDNTIGIPEALKEIAVDIIINAKEGDCGWTQITQDGLARYYASVHVITDALARIRRWGKLSFGSREHFTDQELQYELSVTQSTTV